MPSSRRATWSIRSFLLALTFVAPSVRAGTLVERTVAFVNKRPVLLSDVELARALLKLDPAEAVERSIDETLMFEEASRLVNDTPTDEVVASAILVLQEKAGPVFSAAALRRKALSQLAISSYITQRLKPLVRVEDDEVRIVFNERVVSDPSPPVFSDVAAAIRDLLEAKILDEKIEEWVRGLRLRADIRRPVARK
ncbi:MAG: hypothetical protein JJE39_09005 [Vicinamibacteria bacterium]|nr:hypothetical protein [Vicinamibacteria bacterium]